MTFKRIKIKNYNKIGIICLNNSENLNIIESDTFQEINSALDYFENDNNIKVILIKAVCGLSKAGKKVFSAGVNLKEYSKKFELADKSPSEFKEFLKKNRELMTKIEEFEKPVIIGIDGIVIGGFFEVALACDLILASKEAFFRLNEVNIGLIPGYGGIGRLLKIVGKNKTFEIIATGKEISAEEAQNLGIVSEIFNDSEFEEKTLKYCENLAEKSSNSLYLIKNTLSWLLAINGVTGRRSRPFSLCSQSADDIEVENFLKALQSADSREGIRAFLDK